MTGSAVLLGLVAQQAPKLGQLPATPLEKLLVALVALALVVFIGRFVLGIAWKLVRIGIVVVGALWVVSVAAPQLL